MKKKETGKKILDWKYGRRKNFTKEMEEETAKGMMEFIIETSMN